MIKKYTKTERTILVPEYLWKELDDRQMKYIGEHISKQNVISLLRLLKDM